MIILFISLTNCNVRRLTTNDITINEEPIKTAVFDFASSSKLFKSSKVFYLQRINSSKDSNVIVVVISKSTTKLLLRKSAIVGSKGLLPSQFFEIKGKLFYWWENDIPLSNEALDAFRRYHLLQNDMEGKVQIPNFYIDEKLKSSLYYFCKSNYKNFKKIETSKGDFDRPRLTCF
ncbi:MAG TPA: hypothetical protein PKK69_00475 [Ferruginibacter sp.]|nr:hypothetical protein [Ferruginibacter sp.]